MEAMAGLKLLGALLLSLLLASACDVMLTGPVDPARAVTLDDMAGRWDPVMEDESEEQKGYLEVSASGADRLYRGDLISPGEKTESYFFRLFRTGGPGVYWGLAAESQVAGDSYYPFRLAVYDGSAEFRLPDKARTEAWLRESGLRFSFEQVDGRFRFKILRIEEGWDRLMEGLNRAEPDIWKADGSELRKSAVSAGAAP